MMPSTAFFNKYLVSPPLIFALMGISMVNSASEWSRNGTRASSDYAMVILSTRIKKSYGRRMRDSLWITRVN